MASGFAQPSRGRLEIDSEIGTGTTIRFLFPISRDTPGEDTADAASVAKADADATGEHILAVEDSEEVLELTEILTGVGYRVTTATSGDEALCIIEAPVAVSSNLLFTDLVMPGGMDGMMLAEQVGDLRSNMGVLMRTGDNEELVGDSHARTNANILSKPYRRSELLDRVRKSLNGRGDQSECRLASEYGTAET